MDNQEVLPDDRTAKVIGEWGEESGGKALGISPGRRDANKDGGTKKSRSVLSLHLKSKLQSNIDVVP